MRKQGRRCGVLKGLWAGAALAGLALGVVALCGCEELLGIEKPKGVVRLGTDCLLVLPFSTPNRKPFESQLGRTFSQAVADLVREGCPAAKVLDADQIPETVDGQPVAGVPVGIIGQALGAKYVVIGEIHELRVKEPGSYKVLHGRMVLSASVFNVADGSLAWHFARRTFHWPRLVGGEEVPAPTEDEEEVIRSVMREGAWAVAAVFRGQRTPEQIRLGD